MRPETLQYLQAVEHAVTVAAIVMGGFWALFHFYNRRVYVERLDQEVECSLLGPKGSRHVKVALVITNPGSAHVVIDTESTGIRISKATAPRPSEDGKDGTWAKEVEWQMLGAFDAIDGHSSIESGETITEQRLFSIPANQETAFLVEFEVYTRRSNYHTQSIIYT